MGSRGRVLLFLASVLLTPSAGADSFYLTPDVPTILGGSMHQPRDVVRNDAGTYSVPFGFPAGIELDALYRAESGDWFYSFKTQVPLGGANFYREDVVRYQTSTGYALFFDGSAHFSSNIPNVDAFFLDPAGHAVLSFDVPATLGPETFDPADLVLFDAPSGGFSLYFDASAAGIPVATNVIGADRNGTLTILSFDVPTSLAGVTYLPGELVAYDGAGFFSYYADPMWPASSELNALSFLADPGRVDTIRLTKSPIAGGVVIVDWDPSCSAGAEDFGIYEGQIGNWTSHVQIDCFDDGHDHSEAVSPGSGSRYYLVVPRNFDYEGSYGLDGNGAERPPAPVASACASTQRLGVCP